MLQAEGEGQDGAHTVRAALCYHYVTNNYATNQAMVSAAGLL
jgi:hypothetical protein